MSLGYRHELKYLINMPDYAMLRMRFDGAMRRDPHVDETGMYWIRSLYFDDYWNTAYEEKDMGVCVRKKYRIRLYGASDKLIHLERKMKVDQYILKESAPLTREETEAILEGDYGFLRKSPHKLHRELYYECTSRILRPRVVVDYDREPFIMDEGEVRITFDTHVRAGMGSFQLFEAGMPTVECLPGDRMIMEVKFTTFLPNRIKRLLPPRAAELTAASKYVMCCDICTREQMLNAVEGLPCKER